MCDLVRDNAETTYEHWITKEAFQEATGIDPANCLQTYVYCSECYA